MMNSTGDIATAPERYGSDICITNLARSDSAVTTDTISVGQDSARSSASSGSASPTMCELPAREELPAAEDAALVLLAFCNSAGSRRGAVVPRPASSPAAPQPFMPQPGLPPHQGLVPPRAYAEGVVDYYEGSQQCMSVRTTFDDDDLRPRARGGPARKRHWSGVYREKDSEQTATTDERAAAERRARMNHLRRCNEDMRILLLGWKAVEVPNGRGGVTYEYEHPESGRRAKSKKIIFRMHRGEKLDFNSDEAAMLSERVRELRKSEALTAAVVASATNSPLSTAPPDDRASGGAEVARSGAFFSATGSSSGASPVAEALGAAPRLSPRAYSDLAATTAGPKGGSSAAAARSETTPAGARIVLKYGASDGAAPLAPPVTTPSVGAFEPALAIGTKRPLPALQPPVTAEQAAGDVPSETSPMTCGKRLVKQWPEWGVGEAPGSAHYA